MTISPKLYLKDIYRTSLGNKQRKNFLRLDLNENPDGLPEEFIKNIFSKIDAKYVSMYPEYGKLAENIAQHNKLNWQNICLSNGSDGAIKYIFDCYVSSGDKVLITDPTFAMYPIYCKMFNALCVNVSYLSTSDGFLFPVENFLDEINRNIDMAVIVNPNNPTGIAICPSDMDKIIQKCFDANVLLIVDEAYFYFYNQTVIDKIKHFNNLIVLRTFSKLCGLANVRLGYAAACSEIIPIHQ